MAEDNEQDIAAYLVEVWRTECRRHGDDDRPWSGPSALAIAAALTGSFDDADTQVAELERQAVAFLASGDREWAVWRLKVLDRVLRAGGSEFGLSAISSLLEPEESEPEPAGTPAAQQATATAGDALAKAGEPLASEPATAEPPAGEPLAGEPATADSLAGDAEHAAAGPVASTGAAHVEVVEPEEPGPGPEPGTGEPHAAEAGPEPDVHVAEPEGQAVAADAAGAEPVADISDGAGQPEASVASATAAKTTPGADGTGRVEPTDRSAGEQVSSSAAEPAAPEAADAAPFWTRVDTADGLDTTSGERAAETGEPAGGPAGAGAGGAEALRGMPEPPWPDEFEDAAASAGTSGAGTTAATTPATMGQTEVEPGHDDTDELSEATRSGVGVSVSDRATFESTVCSLVDDHAEFTVAFVGLDDVSGPSLGVPDDATSDPAEEAACRALLWSLARRTADRGTCYAIGRGLVAVVLDRGRPKDVDKLVKRLPASEVSAPISWGAARFPDEANDVRELLRTALVRLANLREEKATPRVLVNKLRRAVTTRG